MPTNIPDRWIPLLDTLSDKEFATLMRAVLHGEDVPELTAKNQPIANVIYADIAKANYQKNAMRKSRKKINSELTVNLTVNQPLINSELTVKQEEKREAPPPCSPSSSPPHPLNITPYNPPPEEKREESCTPGAGACVKGGGIETAREIIAYLNKVCGTRYRANVPDTLKHINARLSEGFTVDDFKRVIDRKYSDWKGTDYERFMRPLTLFSTKFEGYLNAPEKPKLRGNAELSDEEKREILDIWGG